MRTTGNGSGDGKSSPQELDAQAAWPAQAGEGWNVLALSTGRCKLPNDSSDALLGAVRDRPAPLQSGAGDQKDLILPVHNVDNSITKGASVGSSMKVLKVVVRALRSVVGRRGCCSSTKHASFHVVGLEITALRVREKQLAMLMLKYPEWTGATSWPRGC